MAYHLLAGGSVILPCAALFLGASPSPARAQPAADPVIERLNALEARVRMLEARNAELEREAVARTATPPVPVAPAPVAVAAAPTPAPARATAVSSDITIKPIGVFQIDQAVYGERRGGYDYSNGIILRRGRFGLEGTYRGDFKYRILTEFVNQQASMLDAYIQWTPSDAWTFTLGQHRTPNGLEQNSSDSFSTFLERGMGSQAFANVGADRRIGASLLYVTKHLTAHVGVYGAPEAINRSNGGPDEAYGVNGRVTWEPVIEAGRVVHLGASGYVVTNPSNGGARDAIRVSERPNSRVDGGALVDSGVITDVEDVRYFGVEGALVYDRFSIQGEYGHLDVNRRGGLRDVGFDGFNIYGSVFLTGESRPFKRGNADRVRPNTNFDPSQGHWGAFELGLRYDWLDVSNTPVASRAGSKGKTWTLGLNWYLDPNLKLLFNYIRFSADRSPLAIAPETRAEGDAFTTRLHFDF